MNHLGKTASSSFTTGERAAITKSVYLRDWRIGFVDYGNAEYACIFQLSADDPADWVVSKIEEEFVAWNDEGREVVRADSVDGLTTGLLQDHRPIAEVVDLEAYRTARLYLDVYGDDAAFFAAERAQRLLSAGNRDAWLTWRQVVGAIAKLTG